VNLLTFFFWKINIYARADAIGARRVAIGATAVEADTSEIGGAADITEPIRHAIAGTENINNKG